MEVLPKFYGKAHANLFFY